MRSLNVLMKIYFYFLIGSEWCLGEEGSCHEQTTAIHLWTIQMEDSKIKSSRRVCFLRFHQSRPRAVESSFSVKKKIHMKIHWRNVSTFKLYFSLRMSPSFPSDKINVVILGKGNVLFGCGQVFLLCILVWLKERKSLNLFMFFCRLHDSIEPKAGRI